MDSEFLTDKIEKIKVTINLYEDAIDFLITNPTKKYKFDTGQTVQDVSRQDLINLQDQLDSLYNRLSIFQARLNGNNSIIGSPAW